MRAQLAMCMWAVCVAVLLMQLGIVAATHFRGGLIYWKTVGPVNDSNGLVPVEVTQRFGWRRNASSDTFCDDRVIEAGDLAGASGDLVLQSGCRSPYQNLSSVRVYCTDYSVSNNWMVGERSSYVVWLSHSDVVAASFSGGN